MWFGLNKEEGYDTAFMYVMDIALVKLGHLAACYLKCVVSPSNIDIPNHYGWRNTIYTNRAP